MRIDSVNLYAVDNSLVTAFSASSHSTKALTHILVCLRSGDLEGWGECATLEDPYYLGETTNTAWHVLESFLIPAVLNKDFETPEDFVGLFPPVKGNTFALAGIEMAAWDLIGRANGTSVASMLGGEIQEIRSGVSLGMQPTPQDLYDLVQKHLDEGYHRVKLKVKPGHDIEMLGPFRDRFPDVPLMVDANAAYTLDDADHLAKLDPFDLMMIEQPLGYGDLLDHARLRERIGTKVCLDESIRSFDDARQAVAMKAADIINIKVAKVGGLRVSKQIHDHCHAHGIPVWCGGMHDYGIARAANVALSSLPGFSIPGDVSGYRKYFVEDIVEPPIEARGGTLPVPHDRPGLGHVIVPEQVLKRTSRAARFD